MRLVSAITASIRSATSKRVMLPDAWLSRRATSLITTFRGSETV